MSIKTALQELEECEIQEESMFKDVLNELSILREKLMKGVKYD